MPEFDLDAALQVVPRVPVECAHCGFELVVTSYQQLSGELFVHVVCEPCNSEFRFANDFKLIYELDTDTEFAPPACPDCGGNSVRVTFLAGGDRTSILRRPAADLLLSGWHCRACLNQGHLWWKFVRAEPDDQI